MIIDIQPLKRKDILEMDQMFLKQGWPSRKQLLIDYLNEQEAGRDTFACQNKQQNCRVFDLGPSSKARTI